MKVPLETGQLAGLHQCLALVSLCARSLLSDAGKKHGSRGSGGGSSWVDPWEEVREQGLFDLALAVTSGRLCQALLKCSLLEPLVVHQQTVPVVVPASELVVVAGAAAAARMVLMAKSQPHWPPPFQMLWETAVPYSALDPGKYLYLHNLLFQVPFESLA